MTLADLYRDLHQHPELSFQEARTAGIAAERLRAAGFDTTEGVGGTGVVGVLRNGPGPTALLRADMDALPVLEDTGLEYASTARGVDRDGHDVPIAHACGHDVHVSCLVGATAELAAARDTWSGTLLVVFQPAEELATGARAMIDDGLYDRFGRPDVVLGQHVAPLPAGMLALRAGPAFAGTDSMRITLHGSGGHGSRPETTVDPIVMAAATVMRLQTVVSREIAGTDTAVLTIGTLRAGTKENIIPDRAELGLNIRSFDPAVRERILAAVERIIRAEAAASGAPAEPEFELIDSFPVLVNDEAAVARTRPVLGEVAPGGRPGPRHGQRGRRPVRHRGGRAVRVLDPRRRRPGRVHGRDQPGGAARGGGRAAVQPLAVLRAGGRAHPVGRGRRAGRRGPPLAPARPLIGVVEIATRRTENGDSPLPGA